MSNNEKFKNTVPKIMMVLMLFIIGFLGFQFIDMSLKVEKWEKSGYKIKTDTVYVNKPYKVVEIKKEYIKVPYEVKVYLPDTALRNKLEKGDIITAVNYTSGGLFRKPKLVVDKINTKGIVFSSAFEAPKDLGSLTIDFNGNACIKPKSKFDKRVKIFGATITSAGVAYFAFKVIQTSIQNKNKR